MAGWEDWLPLLGFEVWLGAALASTEAGLFRLAVWADLALAGLVGWAVRPAPRHRLF